MQTGSDASAKCTVRAGGGALRSPVSVWGLCEAALLREVGGGRWEGAQLPDHAPTPGQVQCKICKRGAEGECNFRPSKSAGNEHKLPPCFHRLLLGDMREHSVFRGRHGQGPGSVSPPRGRPGWPRSTSKDAPPAGGLAGGCPNALLGVTPGASEMSDANSQPSVD